MRPRLRTTQCLRAGHAPSASHYTVPQGGWVVRECFSAALHDAATDALLPAATLQPVPCRPCKQEGVPASNRQATLLFAAPAWWSKSVCHKQHRAFTLKKHGATMTEHSA